MRRTVLPTITILALTLAGCAAPEEPASPPAPQEALSTSSATAAATPEPPSTSEVTTAEPAAVTQEPEDEAVTATTTPEAAEASGDPTEFTEAGAAAAVEHYFDTLQAAHLQEATVDEVRELALESCKTCENFHDGAENNPLDHGFIDFVGAEGFMTGSEALMTTDIVQLKDDERLRVMVTMAWEDGQWLVSEVQSLG